MKIKYTFDNGESSEVEVSEEIGNIITASRRKEESDNRRERYHCWSSDAIDYEGVEYGAPDFTEDLFNEKNDRIHEAFSHLTETQQRRLLMLAGGLSEREIARREGKEIKTIRESIDGARKNFLKFF